MTIVRKMLPGYNHNICYKGQIFHVQTEDSGRDHPHIITLLFVKGNIISRKKKEYGDIVGFDRLEDVVRELMQEQHKEMLRELKTGVYDTMSGLSPEPSCPAPAPAGRPGTPAPRPAAPVAPPPPPADASEIIAEKPASKTINLADDQELKDEDIFGADIISDKSLDEVILSFLSKSIDDDQDI